MDSRLQLETPLVASSRPDHVGNRHPCDSWPRSLPFKKRRLYYVPPDTELSAPIITVAPEKPKSNAGGAFQENSDEKIAALALVAAAASTVPLTRAVTDIVELSDTEARTSPASDLQDENDKGRLTPMVTESSAKQLVTPTSATTSRPTISASSRQRIHHPPLMAPLPNGCHGRTSRNNSYCRRQPCYNGSKYCKLHYQQIVSGLRPPTSETPSGQVERIPSGSMPHNPFQDKRYSGADGEKRCSATTTRGRACAYVAVNGTTFCYLHSDYETNPPPRRGGLRAGSLGSSSSDEMEVTKSGSFEAEVRASSASDSSVAAPTSVIRIDNVAAAAAARHPSPPSVTSEDSGVLPTWVTSQLASKKEAKRAPENSKSNAPYGLLSSISSDQWYNKKVMITTGPLMNRTGRVVKWGNGWVTVQVLTPSGENADGLMHNRRSVELLLLDDQKDGEPGQEPDPTHSAKEEANLRRCVSREVETSFSSQQRSLDGAQSKATQVIDTDSESVVRDAQDAFASVHGEHAPHQGSQPNFAALSRAVAEKINAESAKRHAGHDSPTSPSTPPKCPTIPENRSSSLVAPPSTDSSREPHSDDLNSRLAESFLGAQGGVRTPSLDLLFGTAALDRSRRKVHKPSRYEDTAMLEKGRKADSDGATAISRRMIPTCAPRSPTIPPAGPKHSGTSSPQAKGK